MRAVPMLIPGFSSNIHPGTNQELLGLKVWKLSGEYGFDAVKAYWKGRLGKSTKTFG